MTNQAKFVIFVQTMLLLMQSNLHDFCYITEKKIFEILSDAMKIKENDFLRGNFLIFTPKEIKRFINWRLLLENPPKWLSKETIEEILVG